MPSRAAFPGIERAGAFRFGDGVSERIDAVVETAAADREATVVEDRSFFHDMEFQGEGDGGPGAAEAGPYILFQSGRAVESNRAGIARQAACRQQSGKAEDVVAVQMGDEDAGDAAHLQIRADELMLGSFAAVEEPEFAAFRRTQDRRRDVA
jgi:hypothetical protein